MHRSQRPISSLVAVIKWLELRQSFYIWNNRRLPDSKPKFMHYGWLQNMTIPTIRQLVANGAIYKALSDNSDVSQLVRAGFEKEPGSWTPSAKSAQAARQHWTQRPPYRRMPAI